MQRLADRKNRSRTAPHAGQACQVQVRKAARVAAARRGARCRGGLALGLRPAGEVHAPAAPGEVGRRRAAPRRHGLDERQLAAQPHAGAVFAADVGPRGLPGLRFGG